MAVEKFCSVGFYQGTLKSQLKPAAAEVVRLLKKGENDGGVWITQFDAGLGSGEIYFTAETCKAVSFVADQSFDRHAAMIEQARANASAQINHNQVLGLPQH